MNVKDLPSNFEQFLDQRFERWEIGGWTDGAAPDWYVKEKSNAYKIIHGEIPIKRILYCGFHKGVVTCDGFVELVKNKKALKRTFHCPECQEMIKVDVLYMPSYRAII